MEFARLSNACVAVPSLLGLNCAEGELGLWRRRAGITAIAAALAAAPKLSLNYTLAMLSRRIFRQLTDSVLLAAGTASRPLCLAASCASGCTRYRGNAPRVPVCARRASSSSTRWKTRQGNDFFAREARVQGLKSRAAFKLLEVVGWACCVVLTLMYCS